MRQRSRLWNSPEKSVKPPAAALKTKGEIVANWFPRYTGTAAKDFGKYVLLVNFSSYVDRFARWHGVEVRGVDRPMPNATADGISILNFGMGSAGAATVMDLLTAIKPKAVLLPSANAAG